jgi:hypothetical protein
MKVSSHEDPHSVTASSLHVAATDLHAGSTFLTYRAHGARAKPPGYCIPANSLTVELQDWTQIKTKPGIGYRLLCLHSGRPQQVPHHISVCISSLTIRITCLSHHNLFRGTWQYQVACRNDAIPRHVISLNYPIYSCLLRLNIFLNTLLLNSCPLFYPRSNRHVPLPKTWTTLRYTSVSSSSFQRPCHGSSN